MCDVTSSFVSNNIEKDKINNNTLDDFKWDILEQMKIDLTNIAMDNSTNYNTTIGDTTIKYTTLEEKNDSKKNDSKKNNNKKNNNKKNNNKKNNNKKNNNDTINNNKSKNKSKKIDTNIIDCITNDSDSDIEIDTIISNDNNIINENANKCIYCSCDELMNDDNGLVICTECGTICRHFISTTPEWRFYGNDDNKTSDPTRCGSTINELLPQSSVGSMISANSRYGESYSLRQIRERHCWNAMPYKERCLYNVFNSIQLNAGNNGISPCIIEDAKRIFKQLYEANISRGKNREGLIASTISTACKARGVPRSPKEIADIFNLEVKKTTKGCKKSDRILELASKNEGGTTCTTTISQPKDFIKRFCSKLGASQQILNLCDFILNKTDEYGLASDNAPPSIAAGTIYMACVVLDVQITKKEIAKACKISEVTISKCFKKLNEYKQHVIPEEYLNNSDSELDSD